MEPAVTAGGNGAPYGSPGSRGSPGGPGSPNRGSGSSGSPGSTAATKGAEGQAEIEEGGSPSRSEAGQDLLKAATILAATAAAIAGLAALAASQVADGEHPPDGHR